MSTPPRLPPARGTYVLILRNPARNAIQVGRLGKQEFKRGWYLYAGSAFGPGGLSARVGRHLRRDKSCRWHIDYLTIRLSIHRVWLSTVPEKQECAWAGLLARMGGRIAVQGFGASDCACDGHLIRFDSRPSLSRFRALCPGPVRCIKTV